MSSALCKCKSSNDKTNTFFFSLMSYRASIPNIGSISISNLRSVWKKTLPNTAAIRGKRRKSHLYYYSLQRQTLHHDPLATVLLGHFNSGASLDSLVLPHRRPSQEQYLHCCHGNTEPEKVNVCTQVSYKERMEKEKNDSETIMVHVDDGCTLGKPLTLTRAEEMLS